MARTIADCTVRKMARAAKAIPTSRRARRWRASPVPDSSHSTTVLAPISIRLSSPNPARATERAETAATARTTMPTRFHARVAHSRARPRCSKTV